VEELNRGVLGSVPDKTATSDYYSEGMMIIDAADPYSTPIMWLNSICSDIFGEQQRVAHCCGTCYDAVMTISKFGDAVSSLLVLPEASVCGRGFWLIDATGAE